MTKKFANTYVEYVAKKPIIFIGAILIYVSLIISITLSVKTNVSKQYNVSLKQETIVVEELIDLYKDVVFLYNDRNEQVYKVEVNRIEHVEDKTIFHLADKGELDSISGEKVYADIPIEEISLFERIFVRGGKNSEE